jgi:hypothetical protein
MPAPVRIVGPTFEGARISGEEAEKLLPAYLDSREAMSVISRSRIKAQLPRYKRQYWGGIRRGRREILIHFYHEDTSVVQKRQWLQSILTVLGGGDQFFESRVRTLHPARTDFVTFPNVARHQLAVRARRRANSENVEKRGEGLTRRGDGGPRA